MIPLNKPIISIGTAGPIMDSSISNVIHLLIGIKDHFHYEHVKKFYYDSKNSLLTVNLTEYNGGYSIPSQQVKKLIARTNKEVFEIVFIILIQLYSG
ncbi:MAG: hypothetical protein WCD44_00180 [Candidatus Babeliales bacterium]